MGHLSHAHIFILHKWKLNHYIMHYMWSHSFLWCWEVTCVLNLIESIHLLKTISLLEFVCIYRIHFIIETETGYKTLNLVSVYLLDFKVSKILYVSESKNNIFQTSTGIFSYHRISQTINWLAYIILH